MLSLEGLPSRLQMRSVEHHEYECLAGQNLVIRGNIKDNKVYVHPDFRTFHGKAIISFTGENNQIYIDQNCPLEGEISFPNNNGSAFIFGGMPQLTLSAGIYENSQFVWGFESVAFGVRAWVHGGKSMQIGRQCLFSEGIELRTSDHHSIIDLDTRQQINFPKSIEIGRRVWIGPGCFISKGTSIEDGAIIGARSLVRGTVPTCELWAGNPARKLRERVSWLSSHPATESEIAELEF